MGYIKGYSDSKIGNQPMDEIISFGDWVRQRRKMLDLTQAALAKGVGCAVVTIKKIEHDERRPSHQMAELLATCLAIPDKDHYKFIRLGRGQYVPSLPAVKVTVPPPSFLQDVAKPRPSRNPSFVARTRELAQLESHLKTTLAGEGQMVFIVGEAGYGKTALLMEFARRAQENYPELIVVEGSCNAQAGVGDPYLPFRDLLGQLTGDLAARWAAGNLSKEQVLRLWHSLPYTIPTIIDHGPHLINSLISGSPLMQRVAAYVPTGADWANRLQSLIEQRQASPDLLQQSQLLDQVTRVLQRVATQYPLLLLLDDLQWVDDASTHLLFHLGRRLSGSRILLVGAYRPSEIALRRPADSAGQMTLHPLTPVINEFKRRYGDIQLDLGRFIPTESRAFVDTLLDNEPNQLDEAFRERLFWHTKGHPLFTIELLHAMQERGQLIQDEAGRWIEGATTIDYKLPVRVEAVIEQRINRLDDALKEIMLIAGIEGEIFTVQVVAHIQNMDEQTVLRALSRQLEQKHRLVREHGEIRVGDRYLNRYQFRHILFQKYLYDQLSQGERRHYHRQTAEALEALYEGHLAEVVMQLAHHYDAAGEDLQAATFLHQAGDQARRLGALVEAIRYYRAALARWPAVNQGSRATAQRRLAECLLETGQTSDALDILKEVYQLFESLGNIIEAGAVQRIMGRAYWEQGQREVSLQHYHKALNLLEQGPESVELAMVLSSISQMHLLASERHQAVVWGERALAMAERLEVEAVAIHALNNLGSAFGETKDMDRGLALLQDSLDRALALNLAHDACRAYVNMGEVLMWHCCYTDSYSIFEKLLDYARRMDTAMFEGVALARLTKLDWLAGRWANALRHCQQIWAWRETFLPDTVPKVWASTLLGSIYNDLGQPQRAYQELKTELATARSLNEVQTTVPHLGQLARAQAEMQPIRDTQAYIQEFLNLIDRTPSSHVDIIPSLLFACDWLTRQNSIEASRQEQDPLHHLENVDRQFQTPETAAAVGEGRALIALAAGQIQEAIDQFRHAAEKWQAVGRPYDQARALSGLGQALSQTGETGQAKVIFDQGWGLIDELASQLKDPNLKDSFLNSSSVQKILNGILLEES